MISLRQFLEPSAEINTLPEAAFLTKEIVSQTEGSLDVAFNVEIVADIGLSQG